MNSWRVILAIVVVVAAVGFLGFVLLANKFRRSFGASENSLLLALIPLVATCLLAWWLVRAPQTPPTAKTIAPNHSPP